MGSSLIGQRLGKYQIDALIGRGAMGEVYRGHHLILDRTVAIKTIYPHLAEDKRFVTRFCREANLAAGLRHPNIVQIHDFDIENGIPYMVMEFIDGPNLKERLVQLSATGEHMGLPELMGVLRGVAAALGYAHGKEMVHRDVKSSNILITEAGDPVLVDFGIARMQEATQITATGAVLGTPAYLSPEQARGEVADARSDIYSLGVVLYEMIAGRVPFTGDSSTGVILKHLNQAPPGLLTLRPDLPPEAEAACLKSLAKQPYDRYQTATELADAFQAALHHPVRVLADIGRTVFTTPPEAADSDAGQEAPRVASSRMKAPAARTLPRRWIAAGILLVIVGAAGWAFVATRDRGAGPEIVASPAPGAAVPSSVSNEEPPLPKSTFGLSLDNADPTFSIVSGDWGSCSTTECQGVANPPDFRYADPGCVACEARFVVEVPRDGQYDVWAWWPRGDDRATDTPFTIQFAGGETTVRVNQRDSGNEWFLLKRLSFRAGQSAIITVRGSETGYANADAVALTLP